MISRRTAASIIAEQSLKPGLRGKINAKCVDCTYDELSAGSWRFQVENCAVAECPLYLVRPLRWRKADEDGEDESGEPSSATHSEL